MSRIAWCALVVAMTGSLVAGCDKDDKGTKGQAATPMTGIEGAFQQMGRLGDKLCVCGDLACAEGVMKEMSSIKEPAEKPSEAQMKQAMAIAEKMAMCHQRLTNAAPPSPPPSPPSP